MVALDALVGRTTRRRNHVGKSMVATRVEKTSTETNDVHGSVKPVENQKHTTMENNHG